MKLRGAGVAVAGLVLVACGSSGHHDGLGGSDAGMDAGLDAGVPDAARRDAGVDARWPDFPDPGESTDLAVLCGGKAPETADEWDACYRRRECAFLVDCVTLDRDRDVEDCLATWDDVDGGARAVERHAAERAIAMGRATLDTDAFATCLVWLGTSHCIAPFWNAACATRYAGTVGDGGECFEDPDCASPGATCVPACHDACCAGTCQPKLRAGEACTEFASCEPGLECNGTVCVTGDLGTHCDDVLQCDFEYWCDTTDHTCKPKFAPGASCTSILQCSGIYTCIGLSIVDSAPGHCLPNGRVGDPCDDLCHGNLFCDGTTCRALPALGEACGGLLPCAGTDARCDHGRCALAAGVGESCGAQSCLPSLFCTSALGDSPPTCAPRGDVDAPCTDPSQCASHLCSGKAGQLGSCLAWQATCP